MDFEEGKLYKCPEYFLIIYPTWEKASPASQAWVVAAAAASPLAAAQAASYWSDRLGCTVRCSEQNEIFVFLKEEIIKGERYINVLFGDKQGWIICKNWLRFERVL